MTKFLILLLFMPFLNHAGNRGNKNKSFNSSEDVGLWKKILNVFKDCDCIEKKCCFKNSNLSFNDMMSDDNITLFCDGNDPEYSSTIFR